MATLRRIASITLWLSMLAVVALQYRLFERHLQQQYVMHAKIAAESLSRKRTKERNATSMIHNESGKANTKQQQSITTNKYAYAFLVSGCSEKTPSYRGFLYNIVVATQRLRDLGSTIADFVVFIQMSSSTEARRLPPDEERLLRDDMGIDVVYLPKMRSSVHECFYAVVKEKFRILQLTQYERVLFLDADMMPVCNLDYMFALSDHGSYNGTKGPKLQESVIMAAQNEACNAGFFMLKPSMKDWDLLQQHIRAKEEKALELPYPWWDINEGWGHVITPPDYWKPVNGSKLTQWHFHASFADQGLLYYWTKYVKKNVSIIIGDNVEHWTSISADEQAQVTLDRIDRKSPLDTFSCNIRTDENRIRPAPYRDTVHFTGNQKPWEFDHSKPVTEDTVIPGWRRTLSPRMAKYINDWRDTLIEIQSQTGHQIPLLQKGHGIWDHGDNSTETKPRFKAHEPPAGRFSTYRAMYDHIVANKFFKWQQYEEAEDSSVT